MSEEKKKRKKSTTMTKRSLDYLRDQGYEVAVVERWFDFPERKNGFPTGKMIKQRMDCFGFADLVAVHMDKPGTLYIQTTSRDNQAARRQKILESRSIVPILRSGNRVHVHGWAKGGARGARKLWKVSIFEAKLESSGIKFYPAGEREFSDDGAPEVNLFTEPEPAQTVDDDF
jgi:hypothetical protein